MSDVYGDIALKKVWEPLLRVLCIAWYNRESLFHRLDNFPKLFEKETTKLWELPDLLIEVQCPKEDGYLSALSLPRHCMWHWTHSSPMGFKKNGNQLVQNTRKNMEDNFWRSLEKRKAFLKEKGIFFRWCGSTVNFAKDCSNVIQCMECDSTNSDSAFHPGVSSIWLHNSGEGEKSNTMNAINNSNCTAVCGTENLAGQAPWFGKW